MQQRMLAVQFTKCGNFEAGATQCAAEIATNGATDVFAFHGMRRSDESGVALLALPHGTQ